MRIIYVDPVIQTATSRNYQYYDGIYKQLIKEHEVMLFRGIPQNLQSILATNNFSADVVIFGLGWFNHKFYNKIQGLNIPSVCILFKPQNDLDQKLNFCKINDISLILTPVSNFSDYEKISGVECKLFPYGFDENIFYDRKMEKKFDIGFSGALHENKHYPPGAFPVENIRTKIGKLLNDSNDIGVFWSSSDSRPARIPDYEDYSKTINNSKIWIATQAAFGDITPRYYEVAASGTLLFCQKIPSEYTHIFKSGYNCVEFGNDLLDFKQKMNYYIHNDCDRQKIIHNANSFFHNNFTWQKRAQSLILHIKEIINENK